MNLDLSRRGRSESCLSDLRLDQLRVGELDSAQAMAARTHIAECERCHARAEALRAQDEAADLPELDFPTPAEVPRRWWRPALASLAAAAAIAVVVWPQPEAGTPEAPSTRPAPTSEPDAPATRAKGSKPTLALYVRRRDAVVPAHDLEFLVPGDTLGFTYSSDRPRHLAVLGRDGAGLVSVYLPPQPIEAGAVVQVGDGIELDDTLGEELVYGVFCDDPVALETLRSAVEQSPDAPASPAGCDLVTLRNTKRERL
ncbi:MAG: hypothetical protein AAF799_27900 [Myxococcota bacterium]